MKTNKQSWKPIELLISPADSRIGRNGTLWKSSNPRMMDFRREEGWQYAPLRCGWHSISNNKICAQGKPCNWWTHDWRLKPKVTTYSSTIKDLSVRLIMTIAARNSLQFMVWDIGNAFCTAPLLRNHKIWSRAGAEFLTKEGSKVSLKRALYGLPVASRAFHEFLGTHYPSWDSHLVGQTKTYGFENQTNMMVTIISPGTSTISSSVQNTHRNICRKSSRGSRSVDISNTPEYWETT